MGGEGNTFWIEGKEAISGIWRGSGTYPVKCNFKGTLKYISFFTSDVCKEDELGISYNGTVAQTSSGLTCQHWTEQSPHSHNQQDQADKFPDASLSDAANYCRNPGGTPGGPWCYTTDPNTRWQTCDVPLCNRSRGEYSIIQQKCLFP